MTRFINRRPGDLAAAWPAMSDKLSSDSKKRLVKRGLIAGNVALLVIVAVFVLVNRSASQTVRTSAVASATTSAAAVAHPLDQLSSAEIAAHAASLLRLPELNSVRNQADSERALLQVVPSNTTVLAKPQIAATAEKSKHDIISYMAVAGDTITSIATKFGVTADSVRWSNSVGSESVAAGAKLAIPPVNGIVYTVKAGDTPASLATRYQADENQIIVYNDAELSGLTPGEQIIIPNGQVPLTATARPALSGVSNSFTATFGGNGYDRGYCTYYVASRIAVPSNWGNANTWAYYAALSGWTVTTVPRPGAIGQTSAGFQGHVAYVEDVSADGSQVKYSDMNGPAGWGRVGYSDWVPASHFQHYIYQ